ncbi:MAG: hypothetical protein WA993_03230 [Candidatus Binatus sp.]|jgi:hypothetical protein
MTLCIAARSTEDDSIIAVSDRMLSYDWTAADYMALKRLPLNARWETMYSASSVSSVMPIVRGIWNYSSNLPPSTRAMEAACVRSYHDERERLVYCRVLSAYGIDLTTWVNTGLERFGPQEFARINGLIERVRVGVSLLVYGFDEKRVAHMFQVDDTEEAGGEARSLDIEGFGAIGSGCLLAHASLVSRDLPRHSKAEMIYRLLEAKFSAEGKAAGVGEGTVVAFIDNPLAAEWARPKFLHAGDIATARKCFEKRRDAPLPVRAIETIKKGIRSSVTSAQIRERVAKVMGKRKS